MAATRISVSVDGPFGLDEPDRMLSELEAATGLSWRQEPVDEGNTLSSGLTQLLLMTVLARATEMSVEGAVAAVKQLLEQWRRERLDPPEMSVDIESVPDAAESESVSDAAEPTD